MTVNDTVPIVEVNKLPTPGNINPVNTTKYVHSIESIQPVTRKLPSDFIHTTDGREATLRVIQYTLRLLIYLKSYSSTKRLSRALAAVSILSAIRRIVALHDIISFLYNSCTPSNLLNTATGTTTTRTTTGMQRLWHWRLTTDDLLRLTRATLDVVSILADNIYLCAQLKAIPPSSTSSTKRLGLNLGLTSRTARTADRIADVSTLISALLGLTQCANSRAQIWTEGTALRSSALKMEARLDELEFWDDKGKGKGKGQVRAIGQGQNATNGVVSDGTTLNFKDENESSEEGELRDRIRLERKRLKRLRREMNELWWERLRLVAEGTFATWDVLELSIGSEAVKSLSGWTSASIMLFQAWREYVPKRRFRGSRDPTAGCE